MDIFIALVVASFLCGCLVAIVISDGGGFKWQKTWWKKGPLPRIFFLLLGFLWLAIAFLSLFAVFTYSSYRLVKDGEI